MIDDQIAAIGHELVIREAWYGSNPAGQAIHIRHHAEYGQLPSLDDSGKLGAQKVAFDAFAGADLAAKAEAQKHEAVTRMSDAVERYLRTHTVARLLKWSMEKFRETKQGPMLAKASSIFKTLTLDSFSRLLVDSDGPSPRLFGVRPDGQQVDVAGMS